MSVTIRDRYLYYHASSKFMSCYVVESLANSNLKVPAKEAGLIGQHQYAYVKHSSTTV